MSAALPRRVRSLIEDLGQLAENNPYVGVKLDMSLSWGSDSDVEMTVSAGAGGVIPQLAGAEISAGIDRKRTKEAERLGSLRVSVTINPREVAKG